MTIRVSCYANLLFAVTVLTSCGGSGAKELPRAAAVTPVIPANVSTSSSALGFSKVMDSKTIDGISLVRDSRPVAIIFFASWCGHCRRELAVLGTLRQRHPRLRIIGLNAYEEFRDFSDQQRLRTYIQKNAPWLTEIVTADEAMRSHFGNVPKIPTLFLYDGNGEVVAEFRRASGPPPSEEVLERAIVGAMGEN